MEASFAACTIADNRIANRRKTLDRDSDTMIGKQGFRTGPDTLFSRSGALGCGN